MGPGTVPARGKGSILPHFRTLWVGQVLFIRSVDNHPSLVCSRAVMVGLTELTEMGVCIHIKLHRPMEDDTAWKPGSPRNGTWTVASWLCHPPGRALGPPTAQPTPPAPGTSLCWVAVGVSQKHK